MWTKLNGLVLVLLWMTSFVGLALAQDDIVTKRVQFMRGSSSATVKGTLKGRETRDYVLGAKAGQTMSVKMMTKNTFLYFNVLPPQSEEALFVDEIQGENSWSGKLPTDGAYTIRVYLVRAEARRGGKADFECTVSIIK
jgi:hypothetical protein